MKSLNIWLWGFKNKPNKPVFTNLYFSD